MWRMIDVRRRSHHATHPDYSARRCCRRRCPKREGTRVDLRGVIVINRSARFMGNSARLRRLLSRDRGRRNDIRRLAWAHKRRTRSPGTNWWPIRRIFWTSGRVQYWRVGGRIVARRRGIAIRMEGRRMDRSLWKER